MAFSALKGSLNQTIDVWIEDSSNAGFGKTGLGTGTVTCLYRHGATATPTGLTLATQIVGGAHTDGGFDNITKKFGAGSARLDGDGDYITADDDSDWYFGANDLTIDGWMYVTDKAFGSIIGQYESETERW